MLQSERLPLQERLVKRAKNGDDEFDRIFGELAQEVKTDTYQSKEFRDMVTTLCEYDKPRAVKTGLYQAVSEAYK